MLRSSSSRSHLVPVLCAAVLLGGLVPASAHATRSPAASAPRGIEIQFDKEYRRTRLTWAFLSQFDKSDRIAWLLKTRIKANEPIRDKLFEFRQRRHLAMTFAGESDSSPVPEPSTALLMMLGLAGLGAARRNKIDS